jgi:MEMO1 family protein
MNTRQALFAGSWYPAGASECEKEIRNFLSDARFRVTAEKPFVGGVVPHAGWHFSGSLACNVIAALQDKAAEEAPDVIVVFGMHLAPDSPNIIMADGAWETPFGDIAIAAGMAAELVKQFSFHIETPARFIQDNTIELQLPFVKYFFPRSRLLPIGAPPADATLDLANAVAAAAEKLNLKIKIIGSTDLTHYGPNYGFAPAGPGKKGFGWVKDTNDRTIIELMKAMDAAGVIREGLSSHNSCCAGAAGAAITASKALGATSAHMVGYSSSYEKNPGDSFVGYAGLLYS